MLAVRLVEDTVRFKRINLNTDPQQMFTRESMINLDQLKESTSFFISVTLYKM